MKKISIVVPCYNEEKVVPIFYETILSYLKNYEYELIFVNDGSKDNTKEDILNLIELDNKVQLIDFTRNFGKEAAMLAGLDYVKGDYVTIMDVDLQDPPHLLPEMIQILESESDIDVVLTRRLDRKKEPIIRSTFSKFFYGLMMKASDLSMPQGVRDYRLMRRKVVDAVLQLREYHRFSKGLFAWPGYKYKVLEFENVERVEGETSWSFFKLVKYAIEGIVAFTVFPLRLAVITGVFMFFVSIVFILFLIGRKMFFGDPVQGWTSLVVMLVFFSSIQLIFLGVIGEYLSKIYEQMKGRPNYVIDQIYKK